jgi:magnesium-transporting ATPase (P-type)
MSVIVKDENGVIMVLCKGADTVIDERLKTKMDL